MDFRGELAALGISYALGCCLTGYYLVRLLTGQDIRQHGSGRAGATNVGRLLGSSGFYLTLLGDAAKGFLALYLSRSLSYVSWIGLAAMFAVVAGHVWPIQLGLRGGKGVATSLGALLGYDWRLGLLTLLLFGLVFVLSRKRTLSIFAAIVFCPLLSLFLYYAPGQQAGLWSIVLLLGFVHRENFGVLLSSDGKSPPDEPKGD